MTIHSVYGSSTLAEDRPEQQETAGSSRYPVSAGDFSGSSGGASCSPIALAAGTAMVQGPLRGWQDPAHCQVCNTPGASSSSENAGAQRAGRHRVVQSWRQRLVGGGHVSD